MLSFNNQQSLQMYSLLSSCIGNVAHMGKHYATKTCKGSGGRTPRSFISAVDEDPDTFSRGKVPLVPIAQNAGWAP